MACWTSRRRPFMVLNDAARLSFVSMQRELSPKVSRTSCLSVRAAADTILIDAVALEGSLDRPETQRATWLSLRRTDNVSRAVRFRRPPAKRLGTYGRFMPSHRQRYNLRHG